MNIKCKIGLHNYVYVNKGIDIYGVHPSSTDVIQCTRCYIVKVKEIHCLGLNPPEYVCSWNKVEGKPRVRVK